MTFRRCADHWTTTHRTRTTEDKTRKTLPDLGARPAAVAAHLPRSRISRPALAPVGYRSFPLLRRCRPARDWPPARAGKQGPGARVPPRSRTNRLALVLAGEYRKHDRPVNKHNGWRVDPFTPKSDQGQISPAASPEILHHTVWRTW